MPAKRSARPAPRSLAAYEAKRDFAKSPEPRGSAARRPRDAREGAERLFCVQKHLASQLHYDFRLEHRGVLLSWAIPKGPSLDPQQKRLAVMVEDHPLEYGDFEGVIPDGYGAGIVMLWDTGGWKPLPGFEDVDAALARGELKFELSGYKLKGSWVLVRTRGRDEANPGRQWLLIKHRDDWAGPVDVIEVAPLSVKTSEDFAEILARDDPQVWRSHRPAKGGLAGSLFEEIIRKATAIVLAREKGRPPRRPRKK
jgi:bifunctional non-homologous end joining protein LigD